MSSSVHADKKQLRKSLLSHQKSLPDHYIETAGKRIEEYILASPLYQQAESIFVYVSMPEEPSTSRIIQAALEDGKRVCVPKCWGKEMLAVRISCVDQLIPGAYGIPEPQDFSDTITADGLDLIIVPCVAASPDGRRLGHGAGYYDRFLSGKHGKTVCLCFEKMLCSEIPMNEYDCFMDCVVTESMAFFLQQGPECLPVSGRSL